MPKVIYRELSKQGETDDDNDDDDDDDDHAVANDIAQTFYEQEESIDSIDGVCDSGIGIKYFSRYLCVTNYLRLLGSSDNRERGRGDRTIV